MQAPSSPSPAPPRPPNEFPTQNADSPGFFNPLMTSTPKVPPPLPEHEDKDPDYIEADSSLHHDIDALRSARNLYHFFMTNVISRVLSTVGKVSKRKARDVETRKPALTSAVYVPTLPRMVISFLRDVKNICVETVSVSDEESQEMTGGMHVCNRMHKVYSEADVELRVRNAMAHPVVVAIHAIDSHNLAQNGDLAQNKVTSSDSGHSSHAYPDVEVGKFLIEVKTILTIGLNFVRQLFALSEQDLKRLSANFPHATGLSVPWHHPHDTNETIDVLTQPVAQLWTQLLERRANFGLGTSEEYAVFVIKSPKAANRLLISPSLQTFSRSNGTELDPDKFDMDAAVRCGNLVMLHCAYLANKPELHPAFFDYLEAKLNEGDGIISRDELLGNAIADGEQARYIPIVSRGTTVGPMELSNPRPMRGGAGALPLSGPAPASAPAPDTPCPAPRAQTTLPVAPAFQTLLSHLAVHTSTSGVGAEPQADQLDDTEGSLLGKRQRAASDDGEEEREEGFNAAEPSNAVAGPSNPQAGVPQVHPPPLPPPSAAGLITGPNIATGPLAPAGPPPEQPEATLPRRTTLIISHPPGRNYSDVIKSIARR